MRQYNTLKAAAGRFPIRSAILHSDRGSQYTSALFLQTLDRCSISKILSSIDHGNACIESFFATCKKELLYQIPAYRMSMDEVKSLAFRYVFINYNQYSFYMANLA